MSQPSISRCIRLVCDSIVNNLGYMVKFPNTQEPCDDEKLKFMQNLPHAYPGIIGAIDCTHVNIIAPPIENMNPALVFLNRKGNYSLNVQIIVNADLKILALSARFPGSVHDAAIWETSLIRHELIRMYNAGQRNFWLIGDSGYALEPWLITPVTGILTEAEQRFNFAHCSTRNLVERVIGILKGRFRCLGKHRTLHYNPTMAARIINSCSILHNYCIARNEIYIIDNPDNGNEINDDNGGYDNDINLIHHEGRAIRNRIIRDYF